ncbi:MAG TPA: hypothetical protein VIK78_13470 [Ruminiclostridium sp.]
MKSKQKILSIIVITVCVITICLAVLSFFNYINIDIMMMFLGLTQLFSGLNQISLAQQVNSKGINRGNKILGIFSIILGIVIIIAVAIRFIVR